MHKDGLAQVRLAFFFPLSTSAGLIKSYYLVTKALHSLFLQITTAVQQSCCKLLYRSYTTFLSAGSEL